MPNIGSARRLAVPVSALWIPRLVVSGAELNYQMRNKQNGIMHFTESQQRLNKIIRALKTPGSVKCSPVLFLISKSSGFMTSIDE